MEKTLDSTILLNMIIVGAIVFAALFVYTVIAVSKSRAAVRKRLEAAGDFASAINGDDTELYYLNASLVDADGKEVKIPDEIGSCELVFSGFEFGSEVPARCCRIAVDDIAMKRDEFGHVFGGEPVQLFIRPFNSCVSSWKVISVSDKQVLCEHPVMGQLTLSREKCANVLPGSTVRFISVVRKGTSGCLLQYMCLA